MRFAGLVEAFAAPQADREPDAVRAFEQKGTERFGHGERERIKFAEGGEGNQLPAVRFNEGGERVAVIGAVADVERGVPRRRHGQDAEQRGKEQRHRAQESFHTGAPSFRGSLLG